MEMAAVGARSVLVEAPETGGLELALRTDGQLVRMTSDSATGSEGGNLAATHADTSRLRLMLEGTRRFEVGDGGSLVPSLEVGFRHAGGDAEMGAGIEIGGGLSYTDPTSGLTAETRVRGLLAHEDSDYTEWGASGSVRLEPDASGRGLSFSLAPPGAPRRRAGPSGCGHLRMLGASRRMMRRSRAAAWMLRSPTGVVKRADWTPIGVVTR